MKKFLPLTCALLLGAALTTPLLAQNADTLEDWATALSKLETSDVDSLTANNVKYSYMFNAIISKNHKTLEAVLKSGVNPLIHREINKTLQNNARLPLLTVALVNKDAKSFNMLYEYIDEDLREEALEEAFSIISQNED